MNVRAVMFDLNGVFIQSPKLSDRFQEKFGIPAEQVVAALKEIMPKVRMPNAGRAFSYWQPYLGQWGVRLAEEAFLVFWFSAERAVPEMIALARDVTEKGTKVFVLSNNFVERSAYYDATFPFLKEVVDAVYYSWQTGLIKPDVRAYQHVLAEHRMAPAECIYFDDAADNIRVAESIGIRSFLFESPQRTREILGGFGLV